MKKNLSESILMYLKEDSTIEETDQYKLVLVDLISDDTMRQEVINYVSLEDSKTYGTVSYTVYLDSNEYHVYNIVVDDNHLKQGIGTILMKGLQKVVGDNDIYFDTLTPSGKALLDKIAKYDKYGEGKLGANLYKGRIN